MNSPSSLFPFFELLIIVQIKLEKVYIIFHANLTIMRVSTINIVDQSGLNDATSFRLMNGYLGTNYEIPAKNSRYSRNLRWSDTHIRLHGSNELLVSSRSNQKFLKSTAHSSENSKLKHVDHALLTIKTQQPVIRKRGNQHEVNNSKLFPFKPNQPDSYYDDGYEDYDALIRKTSLGFRLQPFRANQRSKSMIVTQPFELTLSTYDPDRLISIPVIAVRKNKFTINSNDNPLHIASTKIASVKAGEDLENEITNEEEEKNNQK